jgi:hypothetical protein
VIALSYTEQQEEATLSDVLLLKRWHNFAEKQQQQFQEKPSCTLFFTLN